MSLRIAIDTGGTFTDLVLSDTESKRVVFHKVASTPDDPGRAMVTGITEIIEKAGGMNDRIELLVHGTTVATNTVIQRRGARAAFITTAGFRDVLHIQRQDRPSLYDLRSRRTPPLIPRSRRFEVAERILYDGTIQTSLDEIQLKRLLNDLKSLDIEAIAVGFLHSYANSAHENKAGEIIRRHLPHVTVCLSSELVQEQSEYERFSTCAMNAYVQPVMAKYLSHIDQALSAAEIDAPLFVMKSNGGVMAASAAAEQSVQTILSGPAGGVVAGQMIAAQHHRPHIITADMGGTSFDVSMIYNGTIAFAKDTEIEGLAIKVPMLDIHTVGAGGGSVGWIDSGGALRVGPESAGATPGPVCYRRGGDRPTVTDANLVLGRLGSGSLLDGGMDLDEEGARRVINDHLAVPLSLSIEQAAEGMIRVVNATMTAAIRKLTVERGYDPRGFTLCPFGGAGPLHGAELALEMGINEVVVPLAPGVTSAVGLLMSNLREDQVRTEVCRLDAIDRKRIETILKELQVEASQRLALKQDAYPTTTTRKLGLRYLGQGYDLPIPLKDEAVDLSTIGDAFHAEHKRVYGFSREDQPVELVNVWVSVELELGSIALPGVAEGNGPIEPQQVRSVYFFGQWHDTGVYRRDSLTAGMKIEGPAIVEQLDATTVIWPGQRGEVDTLGQIVLGSIEGIRENEDV